MGRTVTILMVILAVLVVILLVAKMTKPKEKKIGASELAQVFSGLTTTPESNDNGGGSSVEPDGNGSGSTVPIGQVTVDQYGNTILI